MNRPSGSSAIPIWLFVAAAFAVALGLWFGARMFAPKPAPKLQNAVLYPTPRTIADFRLTQANGQPLTLADWKGRWTVVYFGYTSCPDVCPTTLADFKHAWQELGVRGLQGKVHIDFISVDPQRDTPSVLANYVGYFSPDFIAATGSDEELTRLTRGLGLIYSRSTDASGAIQVDHSGSAVIVDPRGLEIGLFRPPFAASAMVADLSVLIARGD